MEIELIEIYTSVDSRELEALLKHRPLVSYWVSNEGRGWTRIHALVEKDEAEKFLNFLEEISHQNSSIQAMLFPVKAYVSAKFNKRQTNDKDEFQRASKHELYTILRSSSKIKVDFICFSIFAGIVAAIGIIENSAGFVIGANVIDPLMNPVLGMAFSSVLGDHKLIRSSIGTVLIGMAIPFTMSFLFGLIFPLPTGSTQFLSQTNVEIIDNVVAIAAGAAGALSFVKRSRGQLVGVMVSLTVLPPTVVLGMLLGASEWSKAVYPLLLILVNVNAILLSAILVFWLSGIKPVKWREIQEANSSRLFSLTFTAIISIVLTVAVIYLHFS